MIATFIGRAIGGAQRTLHNMMSPTILEEAPPPPPPPHDFTQEDQEFERRIQETLAELGFKPDYSDDAIQSMVERHYQGRPRLLLTPPTPAKELSEQTKRRHEQRQLEQEIREVEKDISLRVEGSQPLWSRV
jgi:hypothetical protein